MLDNWTKIFDQLIADPQLHGRWLATLSHLEHCGARKISSFIPYLGGKLDLLQHAAEESRHAFFFLNQLRKLGFKKSDTPPLLGGPTGKRYLYKLDTWISKELKNTLKYEGRELKEASYYLVTYVIERRAESLYPLYESRLRHWSSPISLAAIIKEEEQHLKEIEETIKQRPSIKPICEKALLYEKELFRRLSLSIEEELIELQSLKGHDGLRAATS